MAAPLVIGGYIAVEKLLFWLGVGTVAVGSAVVIAENMNEANKAAGSSQSGTTSYTDACSSCQPPEDDEDDEKDARDAKRVSSNREADRIARNNGYRDAHHLKNEFNLNSRSDLFVGRNGKVYAGAHNGTGAREWLRIYRDGRGY